MDKDFIKRNTEAHGWLGLIISSLLFTVFFTVFIFLYMGVGPIANAFSDITSIGINLVDNLLHSQE